MEEIRLLHILEMKEVKIGLSSNLKPLAKTA
jgi:hypothetical protein